MSDVCGIAPNFYTVMLHPRVRNEGRLLSPEIASHHLVFPHGSVSKESACNAGDLGLIPGSGRSPGEGNGNPLQYSCLENPMDRGAWWATVHGVARGRQDLATKPPPPSGLGSQVWWRLFSHSLVWIRKPSWVTWHMSPASSDSSGSWWLTGMSPWVTDGTIFICTGSRRRDKSMCVGVWASSPWDGNNLQNRGHAVKNDHPLILHRICFQN